MAPVMMWFVYALFAAAVGLVVALLLAEMDRE